MRVFASTKPHTAERESLYIILCAFGEWVLYCTFSNNRSIVCAAGSAASRPIARWIASSSIWLYVYQVIGLSLTAPKTISPAYKDVGSCYQVHRQVLGHTILCALRIFLVRRTGNVLCISMLQYGQPRRRYRFHVNNRLVRIPRCFRRSVFWCRFRFQHWNPDAIKMREYKRLSLHVYKFQSDRA